jgi:succinate dehydrogenase assembly factor 1
MRLSGLQKEVLALYRLCLRECRKKPEVRIALHRYAFVELTVSQRTRGLTFSSSPGNIQPFLRINGRKLVRTDMGSRRSEFARHLSIDKRDFGAIEFLLRKGRRQLEAYSSPGIKDIH